MARRERRGADALSGRTAFIARASRGIGLEIGRALARARANIALVTKTDEPNPMLPGTIRDAAEELGGLGVEVPIVGDIDEARVAGAVAQTAERFLVDPARLDHPAAEVLQAARELGR